VWVSRSIQTKAGTPPRVEDPKATVVAPMELIPDHW
jgi:hypothetical protein